jgi:hypothetical protein
VTENKTNPIVRLMPSLTDVAFLMPIVFLFTRMEGVRTMLGDGDTGWHVRTGEWILDHGRVPSSDIFSFTRPGQPWFAWEWLWDVAFAWLHRHGGLAPVVLASMLVICVTFALLYRVANRVCGNPIVAVGLTILAAAGSTIHWLARPHLFTLLFTVIFLSVLSRERPALWVLPLLTVVWTNLHGGFMVGIVMLCAYGAGELARAVLASSGERREAARASVPYFATAAACLAASLANPYFYHLHAHILDYLRDPWQTKNIIEFQGANFQYPASGFFEGMLAIGFGAAIWLAARQRFGEVFALAGFAHLALLSARNIPIFMIVAAVLSAPAVVAWIGALRNASAKWLRSTIAVVSEAAEDIAPMEQTWRTHMVCVAALAAIGLGMSSPGAGKLLKPEYDPKSYPAAALAYLDPSQRIFTHDEWGDYLIYKMSPAGGKVYVDGRSDFYGGKFSKEYIELMQVKYDWEQTLHRYGVDTILLPPDAALASAIKESRNWRVVYDDGSAIVFRPAAEAGFREQKFHQTSGGKRDLAVTGPLNVISDHVFQQKGASRL